jgi:hypothetical protein
MPTSRRYSTWARRHLAICTMVPRKSVRSLVEKVGKQALYAEKLSPTLKTGTTAGNLTMSFTTWSPGGLEVTFIYHTQAGLSSAHSRVPRPLAYHIRGANRSLSRTVSSLWIGG